MLILRRKVGQRVVLDQAIYVVVLAIEGDRVKLGIDAPADVPIVREELLQADQEQQVPVSDPLDGSAVKSSQGL